MGTQYLYLKDANGQRYYLGTSGWVPGMPPPRAVLNTTAGPKWSILPDGRIVIPSTGNCFPWFVLEEQSDGTLRVPCAPGAATNAQKWEIHAQP